MKNKKGDYSMTFLAGVIFGTVVLITLILLIFVFKDASIGAIRWLKSFWR